MKGGFTANVDKDSGGRTEVTILNKVKEKKGGVLLFVSVLIWLIVITSLMQIRSTPEKVDCVWSDWSTSSTCTKTCGGGKQLQTRFIKTQEANGGAPCTGENKKEIDCNPDACSIVPVDCTWSDWSPSSTCSKSCGGGKQLQTRTITKHEENGGALCSGDNIQEIDCNPDACPIDICRGRTCQAGYTCDSGSGECLCNGTKCGADANHCNAGKCECGDLAHACDVNAALPLCTQIANHRADPRAFKNGFMTTGMRCECAANVDCVGTDANLCVNGACVCGKSGLGTGSLCTVASGKPRCTKGDHTTLAGSMDENAVCSCEAGSCLPSAGQIASKEVNMCDLRDGKCKCGTSFANAAICTNHHPKCLANDGMTTPSAENTPGTSCKCTSSSTCKSRATAPFCGNAHSVADIVDSGPAIGVCGKCKMTSHGAGGFSKCTNVTHATHEHDCFDFDTTCDGNQKVCCKNGSCQTTGAACPT